jgi:DNA-binding MarR family transcriptional regulator
MAQRLLAKHLPRLEPVPSQRGRATTQGPRDSIDRMLEGWARVRPDLDLSPVAIIAQLERVRRIIDAELEATFAEHGLNGPDFAALVTLRRLDQPTGVSQRELMGELHLTSGTMSVRVERLHDQGLVSRSPDPDDRRNTRITLTKAGRALFERVTPAHVSTENRLLAALSPEQRDDLVILLRQLLVSFEGSAPDGELPLLGLALAPAHVSIEMRRALGLPDVVGLLVRQVIPASPAATADIRVGDVLVRAGRRELRSITSLYAALYDSFRARRITVSMVRGVDTALEVVVDLRSNRSDSSVPAALETGTHAL